MPELKQPQEAAKTTTEQPLTTKKKRAMLEYMAIMFAAAFLLVAISLLIKVIDMKGEMEAANTGARENIALLQKDLDAARAESAELQTQFDEANAASSEAADKLSAHIKCIEERKAGNNEFLSAEAQTRAALEASPLPEVQYFLEHFIPAFERDLDELGAIGQ